MDRRKHPRFVRRLTVKFISDKIASTGITGDVSESGLFIRTNISFVPDTIVDIELAMPDNTISLLRGVVVRTVKTPFHSVKNGMGVRLCEKSAAYINFIRSLSVEERVRLLVSRFYQDRERERSKEKK